MASKAKTRAALPAAPPSRNPVGSTIDTSCIKCKKMTPHLVAAKIGSVPTRVQCTACSSLHAFKAPHRVTRGPGASPADARSVDEIWKDAMRRARGPAVPYSTAARYELGAKLNHLNFGEGVVSGLPSTTVCEVIFENGPVKLLMGSARPR